MQKLHFTIQINAPVEKVWETMLSQKTYPQWTKAFSPGSDYRGSWETGSKIMFVGPSADGKTEDGMVARIKENRKHEFVSIEHYGVIMNGKEDTSSPEVKAWAPAYENYTFVKKGDGTELMIDMDAEDKYAEMFKDMWPKALQLLKDLAEK